MKKGVVVVNLGTPKQPTVKAIRQFLAQFLSDRRVVDLNPIIWYPILYGIILPFRSRRILGNYKKIWLSDKAPLQHYMERLCQQLQQHHPEWQIELAMTYGQPSIAQAIQSLQQQGVNEWLVLPLYPQFSSTTTSSVSDQVSGYLQQPNAQNMPKPKFIDDYADHPTYIEGLKNSILNGIQVHGEPDLILLSYHGIPLRYVINGDCYAERCELTTRALKEQLPFLHDKIEMSYQSRFGREAWLQPYTDKLLENLAKQGVKKLLVLCPGFSVDCLETLEEMAEENKALFLSLGGESYHYLEALNDSAAQLALCADLINSAFSE